MAPSGNTRIKAGQILQRKRLYCNEHDARKAGGAEQALGARPSRLGKSNGLRSDLISGEAEMACANRKSCVRAGLHPPFPKEIQPSRDFHHFLVPALGHLQCSR